MRPVNLIPKEQRRGGGGVSGSRTGLGPYLVLGVLGLAVIGAAAVVLTSNKVNGKKDDVAQLERDTAAVKTSAEALRPYGSFAQVKQARVDTVNSLVDTTFNWERVLRSLSRTIPSSAWLTSFTGTVSPDVKLGEEGAGTGNSRKDTRSPAVALSGCTYSHSAVARMMVAMRNIDNVSEVVLESSEKAEGAPQAGGGAAAGAAAGGGGSSTNGDCRTNKNITKFEILVVMGHDKTQSSVAAADASGAGATPVAAAQGAAATASSTSSTGATP